MPSIHALPPLVVNKIAAGEVVDRPASVVKELIENAVDSGAMRIDVTIEKGGAELVRIVDNGCGIAAEELTLAVTNHATSKIRSAEELFEVDTLGFRGEALASIASVSRMTLRSRRAEGDGAELVVNGGIEEPVVPAGCPVGTTIEVRDLFYNTPVRQKFLRTAQTESGHVTEAFTRVALAHPEVHFTLTHNSRLVHDLPACEVEDMASWQQRIATLFGEDLAGALVAVESEDVRENGDAVRLAGFVAAPTESRSHTKMQYLLVNGRAVRDRSLQHALGEAYRGLLLTGRRPICFLRLSMPPSLVDVNVHPQKLEVRFAEAGPLYSQLLGTLRSKFLSTDLRSGVPNTSSEEESPTADTTSELVDWAQRCLPQGAEQRRFDGPSSGPSSGAGGHIDRDPAFKPYAEPLALHPFSRDAPPAPLRSASPTVAGTENLPTEDRSPAFVAAGKAIQLHNRYLVVETEVGLEIIDQHALHERVLYEQLRTKVLAGPLERQRLLVPEPVDLSPSEAAAVLEERELLGKIGVEIEPFGGDTVLVSAFPTLLSKKVSPAAALRELAAQLDAGDKTPEARDLCDELLHMMSCKAAVKYGDPLTEEEITALLAERPYTENHHHCPHGRPTSLVFTREELDRKFQRI